MGVERLHPWWAFCYRNPPLGITNVKNRGMVKIFRRFDLHKYNLLAVVFITGAAVLIVEVTAIRILSIYFGNTIYTDSGVIGVILAALSVGYARGGSLADKKPTRLEFFRTIEKAGVALLVLFALMIFVAPTIAEALPLSWGPLLLALILFFAPSYFLGMLSPFAIKIGGVEQPEIGTGTISGRVFFWSTAGSLVGTVLTAFVFIPTFGLNAIIFGTTLGVLLLGGVGKAIVGERAHRNLALTILAVLLIVLGVIFYLSERTPPGVLFSKDGVYQHLSIFDGTYAGQPARFFYQDRSEDDLEFLGQYSNVLAAPYTDYYALYKIFDPNLTHALFIGGGMYTMPAALHRDLPNAQIDVAEIEPSLYSLAQQYFNVPNDPHIVNHVEDGRRFLEQSTTTYDMIFSDVYYSLFSIPPAYTTEQFFEEVRSKLSPNGIFVANFIGSLSPDKPSLILSEIRTIQEVFPETFVFATESPDIPNAQNIVVLAVNNDIPAGPVIDPFPQTIPAPLPSNMMSLLVPLERYNLSQYPILTDNYAPVEYMTGKILSATYPTYTGTPDLSLWSGDQAMNDIATQVSFGTRALDTSGHQEEINYIESQLASTSAKIVLQKGTYVGPDGQEHPITNIIARFDPTNPVRVVVGTHYDSIVRAYADPTNPNGYMPGANNGASGVALLLETARVLNQVQRPSVGVDLVFFDGEEGPKSLGAGDPQWYPLGSPLFAQNLTDLYPLFPDGYPQQGIIFDMVCAKNLTLQPEQSSLTAAKSEVDTFWQLGQTIAPSVFDSTPSGQTIGDDQTALNKAGVPSFLVIGWDYSPWFNTTQDTLDKCSPESLQDVGRTLLQYLYTITP
jgi:glutaminyl-peptide cyclotransferase